jgi:hypothetical protein
LSDQPFYAPNPTTTPRQPRVGESLWTIQKDGRQLGCELRDDGEARVEVQMSREGEFLFARRRPPRAVALKKADDWKASYLLARGRAPRVIGVQPATCRRQGTLKRRSMRCAALATVHDWRSPASCRAQSAQAPIDWTALFVDAPVNSF